MIDYIKMTSKDAKSIFTLIRQNIVYANISKWEKNITELGIFELQFDIDYDSLKQDVSDVLNSYITQKTDDCPSQCLLDKQTEYYLPRTLIILITYISKRYCKSTEISVVVHCKRYKFDTFIVNGTSSKKYGTFDYSDIVMNMINKAKEEEYAIWCKPIF